MNTEGDASLLFGAMASAAALASGVLLALLCLRCRKHRPPVSIREATESDEYIDSARFWLVHRHQPTPRITADLTMSPFVSALAGSSQRSRISQREPAESDSNHSYQNSHDEAEVPDSCSRDYLIVLPQDESSARHPSGASTPSSGRPHDYENVESYCAPTDDRDYLNVISPPELETSTVSSQSDGDEEDYSNVDGEGNYVNQASVEQVQFSSGSFLPECQPVDRHLRVISSSPQRDWMG
ncbi:uncharacterized protein LOC130931834 isoform X2 [Corythoichthys intestinalis]|uniref:uncharacterized protein LOC130931834 isoform X2 n=1 Tax=Corythoichthys intestinalis TaxID=161448 RepID=UPI0025A57807|nr:uncharacterized protein LOC130931834 isoform X2 [Corythoichthys intestinalis]